jgi:hypothetical protein
MVNADKTVNILWRYAGQSLKQVFLCVSFIGVSIYRVRSAARLALSHRPMLIAE